MEFGLVAFSSLFAMVDPLASAPLFVSMTKAIPDRRRQVALRACLTAGIALLLFALAGSKIFHFFGITVPAFQIVGGLLFTITSIRELMGISHLTPVSEEAVEDPSVVPIGIPLIAGAGSISTVMVLAGQARTGPWQMALIGAILASILITLIVFFFAPSLVARLGTTGQQVMSKVIALLSAVIGVQFIINGVVAVLTGAGLRGH